MLPILLHESKQYVALPYIIRPCWLISPPLLQQLWSPIWSPTSDCPGYLKDHFNARNRPLVVYLLVHIRDIGRVTSVLPSSALKLPLDRLPWRSLYGTYMIR